MEWVSSLRGKTVYIDTAPIIYFIEENRSYIEIVRLFFEAMERGEFAVVSSTITLLEVLVHPLRNNNRELAADYRDILLNSKLVTLEITSSIAEKAAQLRAAYNIRTPDAIQLSTAIDAGATYFFTNDARLPDIASLEIICIDSFLTDPHAQL